MGVFRLNILKWNIIYEFSLRKFQYILSHFINYGCRERLVVLATNILLSQKLAITLFSRGTNKGFLKKKLISRANNSHKFCSGYCEKYPILWWFLRERGDFLLFLTRKKPQKIYNFLILNIFQFHEIPELSQ